MNETNDTVNKTQKCSSCGSNFNYVVGTHEMKCVSCGNILVIEIIEEQIIEFDFNEYLKKNPIKEEIQEINVISCSNCGAEIRFESNFTGGNCTFCTTPLNVVQAKKNQQTKPKSLLPFAIESNEATQRFNQWLRLRWFAPNDFLKMMSQPDQLTGIYIPFWVFDADTVTKYTGTRIEKDRESKGRSYRSVSGIVTDQFDDLDVVASATLPKKCVDDLEPWDMENLINYDEKYLMGFKTQSYQIDLPDGFLEAKEKIKKEIIHTVKSDIGGDKQVIKTMDTQYSNIKFKHILLPIWVSSYKYKGELQRFVINGRTGEVQGERPFSKWKLYSFFLFGIALIFVIVYFWLTAELEIKIAIVGGSIGILVIMFQIILKAFDINPSRKRRTAFEKLKFKRSI